MKLGELRAAIRKTKETPFVNIYPFPGTDKGFRFALQKTPLLAELERVYPGGKAIETGLDFNVDTGKLCCPTYDDAIGLSVEEKAAAFAGSAVEPGSAADDDDLLGDAPASAPDSGDLDDLLV
ncbi:hypothetical protein NKI96_10790 [Mesorhizobium sp. M0292]|uniref:hypothetical protein n=1 Tax=Mesorhizobium sp. M0292 TaxID=2956929 RepID=UPI003334FFA8